MTDPTPQNTNPAPQQDAQTSSAPDQSEAQKTDHNREAARWRKQLRETEHAQQELQAKYDQLVEQVRSEKLDAAIKGRLIDPELLTILSHTTTSDYFNEDGTLNKQKAEHDVTNLLRERPHLARPEDEDTFMSKIANRVEKINDPKTRSRALEKAYDAIASIADPLSYQLSKGRPPHGSGAQTTDQAWSDAMRNASQNRPAR